MPQVRSQYQLVVLGQAVVSGANRVYKQQQLAFHNESSRNHLGLHLLLSRVTQMQLKITIVALFAALAMAAPGPGQEVDNKCRAKGSKSACLLRGQRVLI